MKFEMVLVGALMAFGVAAQTAPTDSPSAASARRIDRLLVARFPNKAVHDLARKRTLDLTATKNDQAEARLREVDPDSDEVALQLRAIASAQADRDLINGKFDEELSRLEKLWAGVAPGLAPRAESVLTGRYACRSHPWVKPGETADAVGADQLQLCSPGIDDGIYLRRLPSR